jgi:hypothetical protein
MNVLIDDDKIIHIGWTRMAALKGVPIRCFFSVEQFLEVASEIPNDSRIYIDSDLKSDEPGELKSKKIFELGFKNIYLVTGFTDILQTTYPWLKDVLPKKPPF